MVIFAFSWPCRCVVMSLVFTRLNWTNEQFAYNTLNCFCFYLFRYWQMKQKITANQFFNVKRTSIYWISWTCSFDPLSLFWFVGRTRFRPQLTKLCSNRLGTHSYSLQVLCNWTANEQFDQKPIKCCCFYLSRHWQVKQKVNMHDVHLYNTRNAKDFRLPAVKTNWNIQRLSYHTKRTGTLYVWTQKKPLNYRSF